MLDLINKEKPNGIYGYAIILAVKRKFGVYIGSSTLYPELKHLESKKLIEATWNTFGNKPRRMYKTTRKGQELLLDYAMQLKMIVTSLTYTEPSGATLEDNQLCKSIQTYSN